MCKKYSNREGGCSEKKRVKDGSTAIFICTLVFLLILLGMCISQMRQYNDITTRTLSHDTTTIKHYFEIKVSDTIVNADKALIGKLDSVITKIDEWNNNSDEKIANGLNDLRQETNNVIDKQNGWLSFWIGILAIVGALIPFLFQLRTQRVLDSEIERYRNDIEKTENKVNSEIKVIWETVSSRINDSENEIDSKISEMNKEVTERTTEINEALENMKRQKASLEIANLTYAIISIAENAWRIDATDRNKYINDIFLSLSQLLKTYFDSIKTANGQTTINYSDLKLVLIRLLTAYNSIPTVITRNKGRQLSRLINQIKTVLNNIYDDKYQNKSDLDFALEQLHDRVKSFQL